MNRDNQPTFNVNRKIANFSDFGTNKDSLKKAKLQTKNNSEDQQHIGNFRNEFDPNTHKITQVTPDEVKDKLDAIEELEGALNENNDLLTNDLESKIKVILRGSNDSAESKISILRAIADEIESGKKQTKDRISRWGKENERSRKIGGLDPRNRF
jgi:hypothetical protein